MPLYPGLGVFKCCTQTTCAQQFYKIMTLVHMLVIYVDFHEHFKAQHFRRNSLNIQDAGIIPKCAEE